MPYLAFSLASSTRYSDLPNYGPQLAIDGKFCNERVGFYHSIKENYPWHMRVLGDEILLTGVKLHNRQDCCGNRLKSVEVRAGKHVIEVNYKGKITANDVCGTFDGPGKNGGVHTVMCEYPISASVITLQIIETGEQILQLDEIDYIQGISNG